MKSRLMHQSTSNKNSAKIFKRSIISRGQGIQLPNNEAIRNTLDGEEYEYLGLLEADGFKKLDMKEKVRK